MMEKVAWNMIMGKIKVKYVSKVKAVSMVTIGTNTVGEDKLYSSHSNQLSNLEKYDMKKFDRRIKS